MLPTLPMSSNGNSTISQSQDKNWTHAATLYLLELIKERKSQLLGNNIASGKKIEVWRAVAELMRQKGFNQTENSVMKKFYNMRRTYSVIAKHKKMMASETNSSKDSQERWQKLAGNKGKRWSYYNLMNELVHETEPSTLAKVDTVSTEETFRNLLGSGTEILLQEVEGLSHAETVRDTMEMFPQNHLIESSTNQEQQPVIVIKTPRNRTIQFHSVSIDDSLVNSGLSTISELDRSAFTNQPQQQSITINGSGSQMLESQLNLGACTESSASGSHTIQIQENRNFQNNTNNVTTTTPLVNPKSRAGGTYRRSNSRPNIAITNKRSRLNEELLVEEVQGMRQEIRGINRNLEKLVDVHDRINNNLERFLTAIRIRID